MACNTFSTTAPEEPDFNTYIDSDLWEEVRSRGCQIIGNVTVTGDITLSKLASMTYEDFTAITPNTTITEHFFREMRYHIKFLLCSMEE